MVNAYLEKPELRREDAVSGNAGAVFKVDCWTRLDRFLIHGSESNTIYATARDILKENVAGLMLCLAEDPMRSVRRIMEISDSGRAPKNEPAVFALAKAASHSDERVRRIALRDTTALETVCRTGTDLEHFATYVKNQPVIEPRGENWRGHDGKPLTVAQRTRSTRGWGRLMRKAIARWIQAKGAEGVAFQAVKYQQRDGMAFRDIWRMSHFNPGTDPSMRAVDHWIRHGIEGEFLNYEEVPRIIQGFELAKRAKTEQEMLSLMHRYDLPREAVPTQFLNSVEVWNHLLYGGKGMPITALIRNLAKMTSIGLLAPGSDAERFVYGRITDQDVLKRGRVHPIRLLSALKTYEQGRGERGSLTWNPSKKVINALDEAFYLAFSAVEPSNKRIRLAVDVSGSMFGANVIGLPNLNAGEAAAAMALVTVATEPHVSGVVYSNYLQPLKIKPTMRLDEAMRALHGYPHQSTYCSLPIRDAMEKSNLFDAFVSYTDSETGEYGARSSSYRYTASGTDAYGTCNDVLVAYRHKTGIPARHAVMAFSANEISVAHPDDPLQIDFVGLDASGPAMLSDFIAGRL